MGKKISEMDRVELCAYLKSTGQIRKGDSENKAWQHAFKLFKESQGMAVDIDCSSCWRRVIEWLNG